MNDFKFKYCICEKKHEFNKYIKISKLFVDKNTSIKIEPDNNKIIIGINDFHKFIEFVIDNELICKNSEYNHYYYHFEKYLDYIFKNNLLDHIKSPIIKRYIKFMKNHDCNGYLSHKYSDIIIKACEYSSFETIKITMKLTTIKIFDDVIISVCLRNDEDFFKIFKYVVDWYCDNIIRHIEYRSIKNKYCRIKFYYIILEKIIDTDNLQAFNYIINQIDFTFNSIDNTKLKPKYLSIYNKLLKSHEYSQIIKNDLLLNCIGNEKIVASDQLILDGADINKYDKRLIDYLFEDESVNSIDFIIEKGLLNKDQINDRFKKSYEYGPKVAEVLVSNGADYELYIDKLMKKTKNYPNKDFYNYLKELKNQ
ncbi:hypothetical protein QLL95_gp0468 [Cotonvirus japonicus]|uniref:Ankyrin repeat protein n=1 Tax=Cotonvirus japonicus TaxID=2811091 RepID=A0ABM7NU12_9VIRU|nr:hypothetical protein QLL95_gp0468 [Cotonvirus japonicus]BCS83655.1 hypothetical protein [Cotonvirus japonicus]